MMLTLATSDAATPTLRRIERAAIAAATPISYHSRELLLLIHEHLQASGLSSSAATLLKEAQLVPLPSLSLPSSLTHNATPQEVSSAQIQWPSGRSPGGFLNKLKGAAQNEKFDPKCDLSVSAMKKPLVFSSSFNSRVKARTSNECHTPLSSWAHSGARKALPPACLSETTSVVTSETIDDSEAHVKLQ